MRNSPANWTAPSPALITIVDRLDKGEGTAGKILVDPSLYNNADQMLVETRNLIAAVRKDPEEISDDPPEAVLRVQPVLVLPTFGRRPSIRAALDCSLHGQFCVEGL